MGGLAPGRLTALRAAFTVLLLCCGGFCLAQGAEGGAEGNADGSTSAEGGRRGNMTVLRGESALYAVTGRAGLLGFLGHDHAITVGGWTASLCWPQAGAEGAFVDVRVATASLRLDTERGQRLAGLESRPDEETIEDLQAQMLGERFLHAVMFPELRFASTSVRSAGGDAEEGVDLLVDGELSIHGRTNPITLAVSVERANTGPFTFRGRTTFRMTDFGIEPENTAGIVAVADEIDLHVELVALRTRAGCAG